MTAGSQRCLCKHKAASHRDYRHECDVFLCGCGHFVARGDDEAIRALLEIVESEAV
jgi:hypothetical protein